MKKIDSSNLVCTAAQSQQLIALGILPIGVFCYESTAGQWDFAGEYVGQSPVIPAWTFQELCILIGGNFTKPDMYWRESWTRSANMLNNLVFLPNKRLEFPNAAQAAAALLQHLLVTRKSSESKDTLVTAAQANARLMDFADGNRHNPMSVELDEKEKGL
jgi:hypothetical protein